MLWLIRWWLRRWLMPEVTIVTVAEHVQCRSSVRPESVHRPRIIYVQATMKPPSGVNPKLN